MDDVALRKFERQTNRLSISANDLEQAISFLEELCSSAERTDGDYSDIVRESLLLSAIISYSRPFSRNEIDKTAKADPTVLNETIEFLSEEEWTLHRKILCLRNKAVAHSEWSWNRTSMSNQGVFVGVQFSIWSHLSRREIVKLMVMARQVLKKVQSLRANRAHCIRLTASTGSQKRES